MEKDTDGDSKHTVRVWEDLENKYQDLFVKCNEILLIDLFLNFQDTV